LIGAPPRNARPAITQMRRIKDGMRDGREKTRSTSSFNRVFSGPQRWFNSFAPRPLVSLTGSSALSCAKCSTSTSRAIRTFHDLLRPADHPEPYHRRSVMTRSVIRSEWFHPSIQRQTTRFRPVRPQPCFDGIGERFCLPVSARTRRWIAVRVWKYSSWADRLWNEWRFGLSRAPGVGSRKVSSHIFVGKDQVPPEDK